jgi:hypothetical protein
MTMLSTILVEEVLKPHVRDNASKRLCIQGIPADLARNIISEQALKNNGILGTGIYLYSSGASENLPMDRLAGEMNMAGITRRRNLGADYVLLFPDDATSIPPPSIEETATPIESVLDDLELIYFKALGMKGNEVPDWYPVYLNELDGSNSVTGRDKLRWELLEMMCSLTEEVQWAGHLAFAASLGLPASSSDGELPEWAKGKKEDLLGRLGKLMGARSTKEAIDEFTVIANESGRFENPETVIEALIAFFSWCAQTSSVRVASDWEAPHVVYRHKTGHPELLESEFRWRAILHHDCWELLLEGLATTKEFKVRVYSEDGKELESGNDGGGGIFLIPQKFKLELLVHDIPHQTNWLLKSKRKHPFDAGSETMDIHDLSSRGARDLLAGVFDALPTEPREKPPKVRLVCIETHDIGLLIVLDEGEPATPVDQPCRWPENEFTANVQLRAPGFVRLRLVFDSARWEPKEYLLDDEPWRAEKEGAGECSIRFGTDGAEQKVIFKLKDAISHKDAQLEVNVQMVGEEPGRFASVLHILSESHAQRRKLPAKVDSIEAAFREPLIRHALASDHGHPVVLRCGDDVAQVHPIQGRPFAAVREVGMDLDAVAGLVGEWRLPVAVQAARKAMCAELDRSRSGQPVEVVDFTAPELHERIEAYLRSLDQWCMDDKAAALTALAWMDCVIVVSRLSGNPEVELVIQLPTHPARLRALSGLAWVLSNKGGADGWLPPLSRLYGMAGPNNWVLRSQGGSMVFQLIASTAHYYSVYLPVLRVPSGKVMTWLEEEFNITTPSSMLALGSSDVREVMDDVCTLNPAMGEFRVTVASDPIGDVTNGIFHWYFRTSDNDEAADWADCYPLNLLVSSDQRVIQDHDVDGRTAHFAEKPGRKLSWHRSEQDCTPVSDLAIFGELQTNLSSALPATQDFANSVSLHRFGACWRHEYLATENPRFYSSSCGDASASAEANVTGLMSGYCIGCLLSSWVDALRQLHRYHFYSDVRIRESLQRANFVALPVAGTGDVASAAGIDPSTAVWKFEHSPYGSGDSVGGHIILTQQLEKLEDRFRNITNKARLEVPPEQHTGIMVAMGKAGINALHALSDNEQVLLGAVTSLAVMRAYDSMPGKKSSKGGFVHWPPLVLPLDPYEEQLKQVGATKRPDFLCFDISESDGNFRIEVSVLESKWRSQPLPEQSLYELLQKQCLAFKNEVNHLVQPGLTNTKARLASSLFIAELVAAAIKIRGVVAPAEPGFRGLEGAKRTQAIVDALLNDPTIHERIFWGSSILACVGPDVTDAFKYVGSSGFIATLNAGTAVQLLLGQVDNVDWEPRLSGPQGVTGYVPDTPADQGNGPEPVINKEPDSQLVTSPIQGASIVDDKATAISPMDSINLVELEGKNRIQGESAATQGNAATTFRIKIGQFIP